MASQDAWARPLATQLVDLFRVTGCDYVRVTQGAYDPATGQVGNTETVFPSAAAVTKTGRVEEGGVAEQHYLECWIDTAGIGDIRPTTGDQMSYQGRRWKIVAIDPAYSGDVEYAVKVRALS